jgi:hypothetical protein
VEFSKVQRFNSSGTVYRIGFVIDWSFENLAAIPYFLEVLTTSMSTLDRTIDGLLLLLALLGGYWAIQSNTQLSFLSKDVTRMETKVGALEIVDPDKIHILALETDSPLEYAWRIYVPAKYPFGIKEFVGSNFSTGTSSANSKPREFVGRLRLTEKDGCLRSMSQFAGGSMATEVALPKEIVEAEFTDKLDRLHIYQAGRHQTVMLAKDAEMDLFRIDLRPNAKESESGSTDSATPFQIRIVKGP